MSFADLKRKSQNSFATLTKELEKANSNSSSDERFWKPSVDAAGNGYAVIRFLPAPDGEELPFVKLYSHAFQGDGGWYIENSLTTLGGKDPVGEVNRKLWNSGRDSDKETARKQKRKLSYYSNIYVVSDKANPENEGKVFLYKYGKKIFDKLMAAAQPEFEDETPVNPFDLWEGANFKLKITNVAGYWNYDKSEFAAPAALNADDSVLENIWRQAHSLQEFVTPSNFKTYEELEERLNLVLGITKTPSVARAQVARPTLDEEIADEEEYTLSTRREPALPRVTATVGAASEDEDDALSYFARLAEED
jgi:hypothetical protein